MKNWSVFMAVILATGSGAAAAQMIQPGKWDMVSTPISVDMPGAPKGMVGMMKGRPMKLSICITPEQAQLGPQALAKASNHCRYTRFTVRGNRIDSNMVCEQPTGRMVVTASGTFSRTSFVGDGRSEMNGRQKMTMVSHTAGRWVGNCKA